MSFSFTSYYIRTFMNSIVSYPDRGNFGRSNYRGNTSGLIIKDLIEHFQPKTFVDVCEGGGTSRDVCKELGVTYFGLDLHKGNDFTRDSVLKAIGGVPADMVFSHPPYHNMINYVAERKKHNLSVNSGENDTSQCKSVDEFLEKSQVMLLNQREATKAGGIYTTLIGDMRKDGNFFSFQSDFIKMMPKNELFSVVIKQQHNMMSNSRTYASKTIFIHHEYLIIFKRSSMTLAAVAWNKAKEIQSALQASWRSYVRTALMNLGGQAPLEKIYQEIETIAGDKVKGNPNHQAKVRQTLQMHFTNVQRGVWAVAA